MYVIVRCNKKTVTNLKDEINKLFFVADGLQSNHSSPGNFSSAFQLFIDNLNRIENNTWQTVVGL